MDKLLWFKFTPTDWIMGKIQRCPEVTQARFLRLCCLYWNKECLLTIEDAEIEIDKEHLDILRSKKIIKIDNDRIIIDFLEEQLTDIGETSEKRREAVNKRWEKHRQRIANELEVDTSVQNKDTSVLQNHTDKIRVEKEKKRKENPHTFFAHLSISNTDHEKLVFTYGEKNVTDIYQRIENYTGNKKYKSLYLTANNWLKGQEVISLSIPVSNKTNQLGKTAKDYDND